MTENNERRKHTRIGNDMPVAFSLSIGEFTDLKQVEAYGTLLDRSEEGIGFFTDVRLDPGNVIRIKNEDDSVVMARVMWISEIEGKYRVGVLIYK
jgi:hypothetical protein